MAVARERRELKALLEQREDAARSLDVAVTALKKCRQKGGAAAFKRGWHWEEQVAKGKARLDDLDARISELKVTTGN